MKTKPAPHNQIISPLLHIAIIMDGNGRWAQARGLPRTMGHRKGAEALKNLLKSCLEQGIRFLTVYAFSSENWGRPAEEVNDLMGLLQIYIEQELALLKKQKIRLRVIGDLARCNPGMAEKITQACAETAGFDALNLTIALSYGSRQEIVRAVRHIASEGIPVEHIDESLIAARLDTHDLPDPDLLIRTGGDQRLSNFLLWQSAYTELYFTSVLWPDFSAEELQKALDDYRQRERRFGTV